MPLPKNSNEEITCNEGIRVRSVKDCLLCGEKGLILHKDVRDRLFLGPGVWSILRCPKCGLAWLNPRPLPEEIEKIYSSYYTHNLTDQKMKLATLRKKLLHAVLATSYGYDNISGSLNSFFKFIGKILGLLPPFKGRAGASVMYVGGFQKGKLLDIGCGSGIFLDMMRNLGWDILGIEPDPEAARIARKCFYVPVLTNTLEEAHFPDKTFDVLTMRHVLEHAADPIRLLQECERILKSGGRLSILTPNMESLGHIIFKKDWRGLEPPRHFYLFSQRTLRRCAERVGLHIEKLQTSSRGIHWIWHASRAVQSEGKYLGKYIRFRWKIEARAFQLIENLLLPLKKNLGEDLVFIGFKN